LRFFLTIILLSLLTDAQTLQPCRVEVPCTEPSRYAEYGNLSTQDERRLLDNLAVQLRKSDAIVYFLIYAGQRACVGEARKRASRAKNYLVSKYGIAGGRIVWKDGGFKPDLSTEIWLLPRGSSLPRPQASLDRSNVQFVKNCKIGPLSP
jgi:hypothetical protein